MAAPASFASMIKAAPAAATRPVETYVVGVADAIANESRRAGFTVSYSIHHAHDPSEDAARIVIHFTLTTALGKTYGNVQIIAPSNQTLGGEPRIHSAQGFPAELQSFIHDLSPVTSSGSNSTGVQAQLQGDPAQGGGGQAMAVQAQADLKSDREVISAIVALIDVATVRAELANKQRTRRYIGASGIGNDCMAYQALSMRGFPSDTPSPQLIRIFNEGHRIEKAVVEALRQSGHKVEEIDPSTNEQWEYTSHGDHHVCHLDGFITLLGQTEMMTLEIKSMNRKSFEAFQKKGIAVSHPSYYDQVIDGMWLMKKNGVGLPVIRCFFIAYCKDNSQYHAEIIEYNVVHARDIVERVNSVAMHVVSQKAESYVAFRCKGCFKKTACWEPNIPAEERGCWHCAHARPITTGTGKKWRCYLSGAEAKAVCPSFQLFRPEKKQ